jgi:hypothetical protein
MIAILKSGITSSYSDRTSISYQFCCVFVRARFHISNLTTTEVIARILSKKVITYGFFLMARQILAGQGLFVVEVSRSHSDALHSLRLLWTISPKQRPLPNNSQHSQETSMPPAGFELAIPASERPQTNTLERPASGIGWYAYTVPEISKKLIKWVIVAYCKKIT